MESHDLTQQTPRVVAATVRPAAPMIPRGNPPSTNLRNKMESELRSLLTSRRSLIADIAAMERRLEDIDVTIKVTADMISQIDRSSLTQKLADEINGDGNQG